MKTTYKDFLNENDRLVFANESSPGRIENIDKIRYTNWSKPYDNPEYIKYSVEKNNIVRVELQERIESDIKEGKNVEKWIWGYVINSGGPDGIDTKSVCYGVYPTVEQHTSYVLLDAIGGGLHWYIFGNEYVKAGGSEELRNEGIKLYRRLQSLK
jgi:hypothetical protein